MKKWFLSVILSLPLLSLSAQDEKDYCPLVEEGKTWVLEWAYGPYEDKYKWEVLTISGDSVINGVVWKKLYDVTKGRLNHLLREENRRVYAWNKQTNEPCLLYDFGVLEGQVFSISLPWGDEKLENITATSFGKLENMGRTYRTIHLTSPSALGPGRWIEGIGDGYYDPVDGAYTWYIGTTGLLCSLHMCILNGEVIYFQPSLSGYIYPVEDPTGAKLHSRHFVEEGKYWRWTEDKMVGYDGYYAPRRYIDYKMEGDSVVGGHVWKKFYENTGAGWTLVQLFRQDGTKLFHLPPGRTTGRLLMDSGLDTDEVVFRYDAAFDEEDCRKWKLSWDSVYISYRWAFKNLETVYRGYELCKPVTYDEDAVSPLGIKQKLTSYWVEGLGDLEAVWFHHLTGEQHPTDDSRRRLTECWAGGELIYRNVPESLEPNYESIADVLSGISPAPFTRLSHTDALHDLQGRRLRSAPQRGVYLQGGRKVMAR